MDFESLKNIFQRKRVSSFCKISPFGTRASKSFQQVSSICCDGVISLINESVLDLHLRQNRKRRRVNQLTQIIRPLLLEQSIVLCTYIYFGGAS